MRVAGNKISEDTLRLEWNLWGHRMVIGIKVDVRPLQAVCDCGISNIKTGQPWTTSDAKNLEIGPIFLRYDAY